MAEVRVSVIMPCLNEEDTIGICVEKAKKALSAHHLEGEVIVVDNGSTDASVVIAQSFGARVVFQPRKGYGAAYLKGIEEARGEYIVMGDADDTYDFAETPQLIRALDEGADFAIGSRFKGTMRKGAMSFSHRYIGNPILTVILNIFFNARISDAHSGFRALRLAALKKLQLKTLGMEFASEMIVAALREKLSIRELPITYYPRKGRSKLEPLSDAWRHVRFMLLFSPRWLFLVPGVFCFGGGLLALFLSGFGVLVILGHRFDIHAMIFFAFFSLLGYQIITLGLCAKTYSWLAGFESDALLERFYRRFNLEKGIGLGLLSFMLGFIPSASIFIQWVRTDFGPLDHARLALIGLLLMILGIQTIFTSFFLSLLGVPRKSSS